MQLTILGNGALGRAVESVAAAEGHAVRIFGRPPPGGHLAGLLRGSDVLLEASRAESVLPNLEAALDGGCRRIIVATTGWTADRPAVDALLRSRSAAAVAASNFSLGVALFGRLVETAVDLFGQLPGFDPYLVEWHRRSKADRPSGTASDLAGRITAHHPTKRRVADAGAGPPAPDELEVVSVRAGTFPGVHLVGFDAAGETIELRLAARDRSAYAAGILATAEWLVREQRQPGLPAFDEVVDGLVVATPIAA